MANEPMSILDIEEVAKPVAETEEEHVIAPVVDMKEEHMVAPVMDIEEDLAALFGEDDDFEDDDFSDDDSEGVEEEEVWEVNEEWLMAPVTLPLVPAVQPPSVYEVGGPSTVAAKGSSFPLPAPGLHIPPSVSDAEVATSVSIKEIGLRVLAIEGQQTMTQRDEMIAELTQQVQVLQAAVQQRNAQIQQLQTMVSETSSRESTLMQCILGLDKRLAELERRALGPSSPISILF
nr:hypothetical protein [Tanacetum cinerariifolium]